jgi:hypothetical protein
MWNYDTPLSDADDDTASDGISQITAGETKAMWENGTLPDESGDEQITTRDALTSDEITAMWYYGILPTETDDTYVTTGGTTVNGNALLDESVTTDKLGNRSVTGAKLFTTREVNRVLGVLTSNGDPEYTQVNHEMLGSRVVDGSNIFVPDVPNMVLGVHQSNHDAEWTKIETGMIANYAITNEKMADNAITTSNIANGSITKEKLDYTSIIDSTLLEDNAVSTPKIQDSAVTSNKIADKSIDGTKIVTDVVLEGHPTVNADTDLETKSLRNVIISPNAPTGGQSGDIWLRYI